MSTRPCSKCRQGNRILGPAVLICLWIHSNSLYIVQLTSFPHKEHWTISTKRRTPPMNNFRWIHWVNLLWVIIDFPFLSSGTSWFQCRSMPSELSELRGVCVCVCLTLHFSAKHLPLLSYLIFSPANPSSAIISYISCKKTNTHSVVFALISCCLLVLF